MQKVCILCNPVYAKCKIRENHLRPELETVYASGRGWNSDWKGEWMRFPGCWEYHDVWSDQWLHSFVQFTEIHWGIQFSHVHYTSTTFFKWQKQHRLGSKRHQFSSKFCPFRVVSSCSITSTFLGFALFICKIGK